MAAVCSCPSPPHKRVRLSCAGADKSDCEKYDFIASIPNPHSFKSMCEIASNVLINTHFQFVNTPKFEGIRVDTIDPNMVCMVKARFACNVWLNPLCQSNSASNDGMRVCLRMKTLTTVFRHISANHMLNIQREKDSSNIVLRVYNRFDQSSSMEFVIKTLEQKISNASITNIDSKYTIEMMLTQCKTMFKMGKDIRASNIQFEIFEVPQKKETETYFRILANGDEATARYTFQSATKQSTTDSGQAVYALEQQTVQPCLDGMDCVYNEMFSTEFLNLFLKSMEKQTLHLTLVPDGPLILHYQLGGDQSVIRFVLAPQVKD